MTKLAAVRVEIRAPVTSFRYPHFLVGRQPSFDMPPPSTIYGHVASALGELPAPDSFRFGYHFTYRSRGSDYEHQHIITAGRSRQVFQSGGRDYPVSVNATVQPHARDFLFQPRLVLYLDNASLGAAFRAPVFPVILGRSQDLAEIVEVRELELIEQPGAYLEHTLLPFAYRQRLGMGFTVWMPRYIGPPPERRPYFDQFITLRERVYGGEVESSDTLGIRRLLRQPGEGLSWWIDPLTPVDRGVQRAVVFHCCGT
jgi:CRISPR-associated protein Cas5t